jgi:hypothetical protein
MAQPADTYHDLISKLGTDAVAAILHRIDTLPDSSRLTTHEAALYLRADPMLMRNMRWRGVGPTFEGRGKLIRYTKASLDAFMRTGAAVEKEAA